MPQFDTAFYSAQIFWLLISFGFLYLMMWRVICPMIDGVLKKREGQIQKVLNQAETLNKKATELQEKHEQFLRVAEKEKSDQITEAYKKINQDVKKMEDRQERLFRQKVKQAERKIGDLSDQLNQLSSKTSSNLAGQLIQKIREVEDHIS